MQVGRICAGMVCASKMQNGDSKKCSPIKTQNGCDTFVSKKNISFGSTNGLFGGSLFGWALCSIGTIVFAPVTVPALAVAAAATVAGAAGGAAGGYIGNKITGEDK